MASNRFTRKNSELAQNASRQLARKNAAHRAAAHRQLAEQQVGAAPPKALAGMVRVGKSKGTALDDTTPCEVCGAPTANGAYYRKTGTQPKLACPGCSAPLEYPGEPDGDEMDETELDESVGDADALDDDEAGGDALDAAAESDSNKWGNASAMRERGSVPSRNADGSPVVLSEFQIRLRREVRARLRRGYGD